MLGGGSGGGSREKEIKISRVIIYTHHRDGRNGCVAPDLHLVIPF